MKCYKDRTNDIPIHSSVTLKGLAIELPNAIIELSDDRGAGRCLLADTRCFPDIEGGSFSFGAKPLAD